MSEKNTLAVNRWEKLREQIDPNEKQDIVAILDRSGSMQSIISDAIGGFNQFIEDQQKLGEATLTTVQFDDRYGDPETFRVPLSSAVPLTAKDWIPRGMTALLDAIGKTVQRFRELKSKGEVERVIFVIYTDGEENASEEYKTVDTIRKLVDEAKEDGWDFIFLGADIDSFGEGAKLGFSASGTVNWQKSGAGVRYANMYASTAATAYRTKNVLDNAVLGKMQKATEDGTPDMQDFVAEALDKLAEGKKDPTNS